MTSMEPGDRKRRLERPPSGRYSTGQPAADGAEAEPAGGSALTGPVVRALVAGAIGAAALFTLGAALGSTFGLVFASGIAGASVGLVLARAAAPRGSARPAARRTVTWLSILLALGAVAAADLATWLNAIGEGGTLGLVDYLLTTFGPFVPGEALIAALAAAWGANAGPVQG